jgi:tetratricopeptide (TPR) repeat protein
MRFNLLSVKYLPLVILLFFSCGNSSSALVEKSKSLLKQHKTKEALEYANQAINKDDRNAEAFNLRGVIYYELRELDNALLDYDRAIALSPDQYRPYFNRALLYTSRNEFDKALKDYNKALDIAPDTSDILVNRGQVLSFLDSIPAATNDFDKAVKLQDSNVLAWYNLGNAHYRQGNYDRAISAFRRATQLDPRYAKAYYGLGMAQYMAEEKEVGCITLKEAQRLGWQEAAAAIAKFCGETPH